MFKIFTKLFSVHVISTLGSICLTALLTRYLSQAKYGELKLIQSYFALFALFSLSGLNTSCLLSVGEKCWGNFSSLLRIKLFSSSLGTLALFFLAFYEYPDGGDSFYAVMVVAISFPIYTLYGFICSFFNGDADFGRLSRFRLTFSIVPILLTILLVLGGERDISIILGVNVITASIVILLYFVNILKKIKLIKNKIEKKNIINYGLKLSVVGLVTLFPSADKLLICKYLSVSDIAIYAVATMLPMQFKTLVSIMQETFLPNLVSSCDVSECWAYFKKRILIIIALFVVFALVGYFFIPLVLPTLFSERYIKAAEYSKWMWVIYAFTGPTKFIDSILRVKKRARWIYGIYIAHPIFTFLSFIVLLPLFGLWGMVYSRLVIGIMMWCYYIVALKYNLNNISKMHKS